MLNFIRAKTFSFQLCNTCGLLIKCKGKMAGYWTSSFFACYRVHKLAKKERSQYPAILTERAWSIKDLLYDFLGKFFLRDTAGSPERVR